eukprot:6947454-Pyramimonas_sp.AAC.1
MQAVPVERFCLDVQDLVSHAPAFNEALLGVEASLLAHQARRNVDRRGGDLIAGVAEGDGPSASSRSKDASAQSVRSLFAFCQKHSRSVVEIAPR